LTRALTRDKALDVTAAAAAAPYWALREALPLGAFSAAALSGDYDAAATTRNAATAAALAEAARCSSRHAQRRAAAAPFRYDRGTAGVRARARERAARRSTANGRARAAATEGAVTAGGSADSKPGSDYPRPPWTVDPPLALALALVPPPLPQPPPPPPLAPSAVGHARKVLFYQCPTSASFHNDAIQKFVCFMV